MVRSWWRTDREHRVGRVTVRWVIDPIGRSRQLELATGERGARQDIAHFDRDLDLTGTEVAEAFADHGGDAPLELRANPVRCDDEDADRRALADDLELAHLAIARDPRANSIG